MRTNGRSEMQYIQTLTFHNRNDPESDANPNDVLASNTSTQNDHEKTLEASSGPHGKNRPAKTASAIDKDVNTDNNDVDANDPGT